MATATLNDCLQLDATTLERVNYFPRQLLTADDMTADQEYFLAKLRRHNRYLHGWGVVCGLEVTVAPTTQLPWQVQIGSGHALSPYGDEIHLPNPVLLNLAQCGPGAATDPCDPGALLQGNVAKTGATIFIAIRYEECLSRPVRVMPGGCGCNDTVCESSRISDSFELDCLSNLPPSHQPSPPGPTLCDIVSGQALAQCPPCPTDPWVVLAQVTLPGAAGTPIVQTQIDNLTFRRKLFSTAVIQEQVRLCCCAASGRAPVRVTSVNPASGTVFTTATTVPPGAILTFSKHLQPSTVNTNTIQVLRVVAGAGSVLLQGTVTYDDGQQSAQFTPAQAFTVPAVYQITVVGSGPSAILDSDNLALDGNADGQPGGNFISSFTVSIPGPTPMPTPTPSVTPTPTPTPSQIPIPLTGSVLGPIPPPLVTPVNPATVGGIQISIAGGSAGLKVSFNLTVFLSAPIGNTPPGDTAQLSDPAGNVVAASKPSSNQYSFQVSLTEPGTGPAQVFKISNMKCDATQAGGGTAGGGGTIQASVSIAGAVSIPLSNPVVQVALVG